jgi:hypothetical protein
VASNGTDYFAAWVDGRSAANPDLFGARITASGCVIDPGGVALSAPRAAAFPPAIAWNTQNARYLLTYARYVTEVPFGNYAVRGRLVGY